MFYPPKPTPFDCAEAWNPEALGCELGRAMLEFDASRLEEALAKDEKVSALFWSEKARRPDEFWSGIRVLAGALEAEASQSAGERWIARERMWRGLEASGWEGADSELLDALALDVIESKRAGPLSWVVSAGAFGPGFESRLEGHDNSGLVFHDLAQETPDDIEFLGLLVEHGALKDGPSRLGFSDFAARGLMKCARELARLGFEPRPVVWGRWGFGVRPASWRRGRRAGDMLCPKASAVVALLAGALIPIQGKPAPLTLIERHLDWLAARGAPFKAEPGASTELAELANPLAALSRFCAVESRSEKLLHDSFKKLCAVLVAHGAEPDSSSAFLRAELERELGHRLAHQRMTLGELGWVEDAVALGASLERHGAVLLCDVAKLPLWSVFGRAECVERLVALGAPVSDGADSCRAEDAPVACALLGGDAPLALRFLELGAPASWVGTDDGESLAHMAVAHLEDEEAAKFLSGWLVHNPRQELIDAALGPKGTTPLGLAARGGKTAAVALLLKAGACVDAREIDGSTPFALVGKEVQEGQHGEEVWLAAHALLVAGADPAARDRDGITALQRAAAYAPLSIVMDLARVHPQDFLGAGPEARSARARLQARGPSARAFLDSLVVAQAVETPGSRSTARRL